MDGRVVGSELDDLHEEVHGLLDDVLVVALEEDVPDDFEANKLLVHEHVLVVADGLDEEVLHIEVQDEVVEAVEHLVGEGGDVDLNEVLEEDELDALGRHEHGLVHDPGGIEDGVKPREEDVLLLLAEGVLDEQLPEDFELHLVDLGVGGLEQIEVEAQNALELSDVVRHVLVVDDLDELLLELVDPLKAGDLEVVVDVDPLDELAVGPDDLATVDEGRVGRDDGLEQVGVPGDGQLWLLEALEREREVANPERLELTANQATDGGEELRVLWEGLAEIVKVGQNALLEERLG